VTNNEFRDLCSKMGGQERGRAKVKNNYAPAIAPAYLRVQCETKTLSIPKLVIFLP
jgi:hypothetical protein